MCVRCGNGLRPCTSSTRHGAYPASKPPMAGTPATDAGQPPDHYPPATLTIRYYKRDGSVISETKIIMPPDADTYRLILDTRPNL